MYPLYPSQTTGPFLGILAPNMDIPPWVPPNRSMAANRINTPSSFLNIVAAGIASVDEFLIKFFPDIKLRTTGPSKFT